MSIVLRSNKVTAVLLPGGWHQVNVGTFEIAALELRPEPVGIEATAEDWGFTFIEQTGTRVSGRMSSLLAVREA